MVTQEKFDLLVDTVRDVFNVLSLMDASINKLEETAKSQENQIKTLQEEVLRLNGIVDT
jgi:predicted ATP-grasp superfamily ATP-dependent carboligase